MKRVFFSSAHQVKIINYSLSRLEINVPIHDKQKNYSQY
jgi:hypothetical protein